MDPPSYGRGPGGEIWKIEDAVFSLICKAAELLSNEPLFFLINSRLISSSVIFHII